MWWAIFSSSRSGGGRPGRAAGAGSASGLVWRRARSAGVLNLGGIGNLTRLDPALPVIGFDTGPGNMLMDAWIADCQPGARFDAGGAWRPAGVACLRCWRIVWPTCILPHRRPRAPAASCSRWTGCTRGWPLTLVWQRPMCSAPCCNADRQQRGTGDCPARARHPVRCMCAVVAR